MKEKFLNECKECKLHSWYYWILAIVLFIASGFLKIEISRVVVIMGISCLILARIEYSRMVVIKLLSDIYDNKTEEK